MNKKELIEALEKLPDDVIIMFQVVGKEGGCWIMEAEVSGILEHIKWEHPAACITFSHPKLLNLDPVTWEE